jgi:L-lactate dehydrogenase complex protein LldE
VRVLRAAGERAGRPLDLIYPRDQTCCGQIHHNSGERAVSTRLMQHFLQVFEGAEWIVTPSASCAAMVRDQYPAITPRVAELSQFVVGELGVTDLGARFEHRVALHSTCHSTRFLGLTDEPLSLLQNVDGLDLVGHRHPDECCGFGGTFAVKNPEVSEAMMDDKLDAFVDSGAEFVTAVDDSCLMHLEGGLRRRGSPIRTLHLARILDPGRTP